MQPGISSYSFPWKIMLDEGSQFSKCLYLLEIASEWNIGTVQFGDNLPLASLSPTEMSELKSIADVEKINIEVGTRRLASEQLDGYLEIATFFSSPFLRIVIDDEGYQPCTEQINAVIQQHIGSFEKNQVVLAIENHDRHSSIQLRRILDHIGSPYLGICLDTANSYGCAEGVKETVTLLAPYTVNLHVKDFKISRIETKMGFVIEGATAGCGQANIPRVVQEVQKYSRCLSATIETWSCQKENAEATMVNEFNMARDSVHYLKSLLIPEP